jgi:hypothetical protein
MIAKFQVSLIIRTACTVKLQFFLEFTAMTKFFSILHKAGLHLVLMSVLALPLAIAGYSSIHVFGDGVCTTTASPAPPELFFGGRFCDGPVWIEKLSELQQVTYNASKNNSFFGHTSFELLDTTAALAPPVEAATSLFIIWSANADFVNFMTANEPPYGSIPPWTSLINQSILNHKTAVATLYNKGARIIIMPNAADVAAVPEFNNFAAADRNFVRARVIEFNNLFTTALDELEADPELAGLTIIRPSTFAFFDNVQADPGAFGMTNPVPDNAAIEQGFADPFVQGADFVFWDTYHPTAKFQNELANFVNALIPPLDNVPPVITLPGNIVKAVTGTAGTVVNFTTSAVDLVDGPVGTTAVPASGSTFPVGTTTVNVSASDFAGNVANDSFTVTVVNLNSLLKNVVITPAGAGAPAISGLIQGGPPSGQVILQASTDLGKSDPWRDLSTIQLDASGNQSFGPIQDPLGAGLKRDFFRIKLPVTASP